MYMNEWTNLSTKNLRNYAFSVCLKGFLLLNMKDLFAIYDIENNQISDPTLVMILCQDSDNICKDNALALKRLQLQTELDGAL